jgi:hypothetical protein
MQYGIYIQDGTRVCDAHLNLGNNLINKEEFNKIQTVQRAHSSNKVMTLSNECIMVAKKSNLFSDFRDIKYLDDAHCMKITGWSKANFLLFSNHIHGIKETSKRNKYQLVALYRYWLRTGIDQSTLASLFGETTIQRNISKYLDDIRNAIYKCFVPRYLGANKDRAFYIKFNTTMGLKLHDIPSDNLVLVADGTYHKIEKSANNEMQYKTYSGQKKDNLFKPFIICCADGYIVDCYGPFAANQNDATILDYIIETDTDLQALLVPDKTTFILDRGMQNNFNSFWLRYSNL